MVDEEQMFELYSPLLTIRFWEVYKPIIMRMREASGYPSCGVTLSILRGVEEEISLDSASCS